MELQNVVDCLKPTTLASMLVDLIGHDKSEQVVEMVWRALVRNCGYKEAIKSFQTALKD